VGKGRPKGGKNNVYSVDDKLRIVKLYLDNHISTSNISKQEGIARSLIWNWIDKYLKNGESGLINKKKTGNKFAALSNSKSLSKEDCLRLENMKLKIEIERLKKGYQVKGVGVNKVFVTSKEKNMK